MIQQIQVPLEVDVFGWSKDVKQPWLLSGLIELSKFHEQHCSEYGRMLSSLWTDPNTASSIDQIPWLPVRIFKLIDLKSVPPDQVVRTLVSSGTTGAAVSRIHLDADTARSQTRALAKITSEFTGNKRMPMLILDNDGFLKDRSKFNARAAGILGFSNFGRNHLYLLDEELRPDWEALQNWLSNQGDQPILLFGFTFIVWQSFVQAARKSGIKLEFPEGSLLIHGGGWKKMIDESVDNVAFKKALSDVFSIDRVHNYYGMVEQVGSIFFECSEGHLHAPAYADIIIRDTTTLEPLPFGNAGLVQVLSLLPRSYPGHSILTEDVGTIHGEDDCLCGRQGKYFSIHGRIKNVEMRGCSDTRAVPTS